MSLLALKCCGKSFFMCSLEKTPKSVWDEGLAGLLQNLISTADALKAPLFWQKTCFSADANSKILKLNNTFNIKHFILSLFFFMCKKTLFM